LHRDVARAARGFGDGFAASGHVEAMYTETDAQLARRGQAGDRRALDAIYRRYRPLVAATAHRLLRGAADADDTVQETFLIVFQRLAQLADPAALCGWIVQIAARRAHRVFRVRRLAQRMWLDDPQAAIDSQASSAARPDRLAELALLERALDMPPPLRTAWILRHADGIALDDIAVRCACSVATVKRRLTDAQAIIERHVDHTPSTFVAAAALRPMKIRGGVDAITRRRSIS
jgi:RNA polymerase sigma-70 factor (ECF subfamily)